MGKPGWIHLQSPAPEYIGCVEGTCLGGRLLVRVLCRPSGRCGVPGRPVWSPVVFLRGGSSRRSYRSPFLVGVGAGCRGGVLVA